MQTELGVWASRNVSPSSAIFCRWGVLILQSGLVGEMSPIPRSSAITTITFGLAACKWFVLLVVEKAAAKQRISHKRPAGVVRSILCATLLCRAWRVVPICVAAILTFSEHACERPRDLSGRQVADQLETELATGLEKAKAPPVHE